MAYKTTKKDFAEFKKEAEYWQKYFGLINWDFFYDHNKNDGSRASIFANVQGRNVTFLLATEWNYPAEKNEVKRCAFHEVCELMLLGLGALAEHGYSRVVVDTRTHDIIRRLENTIFKEKRG